MRLTFLIILCFSLILGSSFSIQGSIFQPINEQIIEREGYLLSYDGRTKNACWVYEKLIHDDDSNNINRHNLHFRPDKDIPCPIRVTLDDYAGSGYDLGHLCPFFDWRHDSEAAHDTFLLSNISPQSPHLNRGHWLQLERLVRQLTLEYSIVHVITMPLFLAHEGIVSYPVIGKNQVAVPTHFCKVIFAETNDRIDVLAFVLPNDKIPSSEPLENFQTSLDNVEKLAGMIFPYNHPELSGDEEN